MGGGGIYVSDLSVGLCVRAYVSAGGLSDRFAVEFSSLTSNIGPVNNDYNLHCVSEKNKTPNSCP